MAPNQAAVVVIEDDDSMRRSIGRLLSAYGVGARLFTSAEDFLATQASQEVHCLVVDIGLGGLSGIELRRQMAASGVDVPTIFITARDDAATMARATEVGCVACLRKPFSGRDLIDAIALARR